MSASRITLEDCGDRFEITCGVYGAFVHTAFAAPYYIAAGNPCRVIRKRFDDELIAYLPELKWWDKSPEWISANMDALCSGDLSLIRSVTEV